jgi:hypothetical protein
VTPKHSPTKQNTESGPGTSGQTTVTASKAPSKQVVVTQHDNPNGYVYVNNDSDDDHCGNNSRYKTSQNATRSQGDTRGTSVNPIRQTITNSSKTPINNQRVVVTQHGNPNGYVHVNDDSDDDCYETKSLQKSHRKNEQPPSQTDIAIM